jgi:hypothetical protein
MVHRVPVVGRRLGGGLGALREREYRLLFGATLTTGMGWSSSFFLCAALLARMRIAPRAGGQPQRFLHELRAGWREFTARTWLWSTVLLFGIGNVFFMFLQVLGPAVAKERLGGAGAWAAILTVGGIGAIAGGLAALRQHPSRPLVACVLWPLAILPEFAALAAGAPTWVIAAGAFAGGFGIAIHVALWFTIFQREVPEHAQSRVASYDAFGSFVLSPFGAAIAGPLAVALGTSSALWLAAVALLVGNVTMLLIPAVWRIEARPPEGLRLRSAT